MNKANWKSFYQHSLLLFQFLEQHTDKLFLEAERKSLNYAEDGYGIFSTAQNSGYTNLLPVAPRFMHTICQLRTADDLSQFETLLQSYQTLYAQALQKTELRYDFLSSCRVCWMSKFTKSTSTAVKRFHPKPIIPKTDLCAYRLGLMMQMTMPVLNRRLTMLMSPSSQ